MAGLLSLAPNLLLLGVGHRVAHVGRCPPPPILSFPEDPDHGPLPLES